MNSSRCSKLLLVLLAVLVVAGGAAGAVSVSDENTPGDIEVGSTVSATYTFNQLYQNPALETWTLVGTTQLRNVTWTAQTLNQAGEVQNTTTTDGQSLERPVALEDDIATVRVRINAQVPELGNYTYDPEQTLVFAQFRQVRTGGTSGIIGTYNSHYYTSQSQQARQAIDEAQAAIDEAGGDQQAQRTLQNAISAYNSRNFGNAADLANQAQSRAEQSQQSQQRTQLILFAGIGVVVLLVVIGGVYWYRKQQTASKL